MTNILLEEFYKTINDINTKLCCDTGEYLFIQIGVLMNALYENPDNNYSLSGFAIKIPNIPSHTKPSDTNDITVYLDIHTECLKSPNISYPLDITAFDVVVKGEPDDTMVSWHLDGDKKEKINEYNQYSHPYYHITFGGKKMEEAVEQRTHDFGQTLIMRTPRFMHPPMDIILGIDFILNHYIAKEYADYFLENTEYQNIVCQMKEFLWKPYALAFAKNFCDKIYIDRQRQNLEFDNNFCNKIIGNETNK